MDRVLTGVKPTGILHIGNYFGAIKPILDYQNTENDIILFIADYHALNYIKSKEELKTFSFDLACSFLACGLDTNKVLFFRQSDIADVFELTSILNNVTPKGLMNRAHAYKAIVEENIANNQEKDLNVNMGLYCYPVLMASDILLYGTKYVPVGQDQKQHCEIARDIAISFNARYGETFILPEPVIQEDVATVIGLDGRKMSKSYGNTIQLFADENTLKKTIMKIVTDSKLPGEPKDENCNLAKIYSLFATEQQKVDFKQRLKEGISYGEAKQELFELANSFLKPLREKYEYFKKNPKIVEQILVDGAKKARFLARKQLNKVRKRIGVGEIF